MSAIQGAYRTSRARSWTRNGEHTRARRPLDCAAGDHFVLNPVISLNSVERDDLDSKYGDCGMDCGIDLENVMDNGIKSGQREVG